MAYRATVLAIGLSLLASSTADARVFHMSGSWRLARAAVSLPENPGFVPGMGTVAATGSAPARLTVMAGRFTETAPGTLHTLPGPTLVQLSTMFEGMGPSESAMFAPGAKPSRPADFSWEVLGPYQPDITPFFATVRYRTGPNQFGGVARMLLAGSGTFAVALGHDDRILHVPFGFGGAVGGAYAGMASVMLPAGDITQQVPPATGVITTPGPVVGMGIPRTVVTTGFPWTTGKLTIRVPAQSFGDAPTTVTLTGLDARTPLGAGHIVMVAGGLARTVPGDFLSIHTDVLDLTLAPIDVPALSRAGVAAAAFALLAAGYALRRRL